MKSVVITGSSRGIGLEFCKQYLQSGWRVYASCRNPQRAEQLNALSDEYPQLTVAYMDMLDHAGIDDFVRQFPEQQLDLLIANAGIYGDSRGCGFGNIDFDAWRTAMETNVYGIIKTAEALQPYLKLSKQSLIAVLSSQMGSIADNGSGGSILYRSSKAALNASMKSVALDLQSDGIGVIIFHPGWVLTDMGGPQALINAKTSVSGMKDQISRFTLKQSGRFIKYDGTELPW